MELQIEWFRPHAALANPRNLRDNNNLPCITGLNQERIQCNCANDTISAHWCAQTTLLSRGGY
jgi:hypothetical protein